MDERPLPSKQEQEDLRVGRILETGIKGEFWRLYEKLLLAHIEGKTQELLQTEALPGEDGVQTLLRSERNKGAILGLRLALTLPSGIVQGQTIPLRKKLFGHSAIDED